MVEYYPKGVKLPTDAHGNVRGRTRRNMPDAVPVVILARMAVDEKHRGSGLGSALLQSAIETTLAAAQTIGIALFG
jgi:predicted N-acetyltransferase YhbS